MLPYTEVVRGLLYTQRMNAEMFSVLALLGLVSGGVGIFSVVNLPSVVAPGRSASAWPWAPNAPTLAALSFAEP